VADPGRNNVARAQRPAGGDTHEPVDLRRFAVAARVSCRIKSSLLFAIAVLGWRLIPPQHQKNARDQAVLLC
jgi:hypothetical protein